jgi:aspartyl aminopeptidase
MEEYPMSIEELKSSLLAAPKNGYARISAEERAEMEAYCKRYMAFMDAAKTERESTAWAVAEAEKRGFVPFVSGMDAKPGDKIYYNNRGKAIALAVIGTEPLSNGANICAAHEDSPRMDIKPNPLYEDSEIAYFKTHYYGGIKKYQWPTLPLALHGVVCCKDGRTVNVTIGEDPADPVLMISDLLPHLAADQMQKTAGQVIAGEQLNVILGTEPLEGEGSDLVKLHIMKWLNEKYGIVESDFLSAELNVVPAGPCREVGLDRSLIAAYGHDDRVCVYAELDALFNIGTPTKTAVCILADKEEIGSVGISGMQSQFFEHFMGGLCDAQGVKLTDCFANSFCLSADVSNAFDPNWPETCDRRNNSKLNYGVAICKYTGSRGKGGASDASAEAMCHIRSTFDNNNVIWQIATLGKVDQGGGGTVAAYMANRNIVTVDAGVPVLSMHAPYELVSKLDCYHTMLACKAIYLA